MAVEKIGVAYVIKAAPVKAGTTSTGQSWANLVTQQKYQLWKIANAEAARRIKFEQMNAQRQQQVVDQMRRDLMNQQENTRTQIANLKQLQVEDIAKQQAEIARETNLRGRPERRTRSAGGGGGYSGQRYNLTVEENKLRKQNQDAIRTLSSLIQTAQGAGEDATTMTKWAQGKQLDPSEQNVIDQLSPSAKTLAEGLKDAQQHYSDTSNTLKEFLLADEPGRHKFVQDRLSGGLGGGFGSGGSRTYYTKGQPIATAPVADRTPAIKELQDRLKQLEKQQLELKDVDIPIGDEIRTTRQILGSKFGEGTQRLPEQPMVQPAPVQEQPQVEEPSQDFSNVRPVDREILDLVAEPEDMEPARKAKPQAQTVKKPVIKPTEEAVEEAVEEPGISLTDLASMAYGDQPTVLEESMQRYTQPMGTAERYDPSMTIEDIPYTEMDDAIYRMEERYTTPQSVAAKEAKAVMDTASQVQSNADLQITGLKVLEDYRYLQQSDPAAYREVRKFVEQAVENRLGLAPGTKRQIETDMGIVQPVDRDYFEFQPSTAVLQTPADIESNVLQQMRQAEIEALQGIVEESIPKSTPFREAKAVMDEASKTFNNADLQMAGLQMLQDYAYLQQTDPEEYFKVKDVVTSAVAKRLNKKEFQVQQAAKVLIKANQVTAQKLANTVKGATVKDAELVMQLTGSLFNDVNSIESSYENAKQQINLFADKGGLTEDQRTQMLTLLENYKAYKSLVVER